MAKFAEILINRKIHGHKSPTLTYAIPPELSSTLTTGKLVEIPLRKQTTKGIVLNTHQHQPKFATKPILKIAEEIGLNSWQIKLIKWISEYYHCPLFKILPAFIPKKLLSNVKYSTVCRHLPIYEKFEVSRGTNRPCATWPLSTVFFVPLVSSIL